MLMEMLNGQKFNASDIHNLCFAAKPLDNNHKLSRSLPVAFIVQLVEDLSCQCLADVYQAGNLNGS